MLRSTSWRPLQYVVACVLTSLLAVPLACGGGDDDGGTDTPEPTIERTATPDTGDGNDEDDHEETASPTTNEGDGSDGDGDGDDGDGGEAIDACALLSSEEIGNALGEEVGDGARQDNDPFIGCYWATESFNSVTLSILSEDRETVEGFFEFLVAESEPVDGLGDRAQWTQFGNLVVIMDGYYVDMSVFNTDVEEDEQLAIALDLAAIVLDRLP